MSERETTTEDYESKVVPLREEMGTQGVRGIGEAPGLSGGGGGSMDGLEPRVAKLEAYTELIQRDVGEIKGDLKDVRDRVLSLEYQVKRMPGYFGSILIAITIIAAIGGITTFQEQVRTFLGQTTTQSQ